nr:unnamed protein product [Callosobruchus analis]
MSAEICTLVFYGKSKIKSIIFLTVDLHMTNQKEIFEELTAALNNLQEANDLLKKQVSHLQKGIGKKDSQIQEGLKQIEDKLNTQLKISQRKCIVK